MATSHSKGSGRQRSSSMGNILSSPLSSRPRVTSDSPDSSIQPRNKRGSSYDHGLVERLGESDDSHNMVGAMALELDEGHNEPKQPSSAFSKAYSYHAHHTRPTASSRPMAGGSGQKGSYSHSSLPTPPVPLLPLSHPAPRQQGRESERSTRSQRHKRQRDFLSQDIMGDRETTNFYSSGPGHASVHHVLSLQDEMSSHRGGSLAVQRRGAEAVTRTSHEEMVSILETADHVLSRTHHSPQQLHSHESDTAESPQLQPLQQVLKPQAQPIPGQDSSGTQGRYYPVFFSPESGRLFMQAEGSYHVLPDQFTDNPVIQPALVHNQPQSTPNLSPWDASGRQTSTSYDMATPHDYYHCSIVMMLLFALCLDILAVLLCSIPALWFAKKAMQAKHNGDFAQTLSLGTRALCFNIIGGLVHVLYLCAITFTPILLHFVFEVL